MVINAHLRKRKSPVQPLEQNQAILPDTFKIEVAAAAEALSSTSVKHERFANFTADSPVEVHVYPPRTVF